MKPVEVVLAIVLITLALEITSRYTHIIVFKHPTLHAKNRHLTIQGSPTLPMKSDEFLEILRTPPPPRFRKM